MLMAALALTWCGPAGSAWAAPSCDDLSDTCIIDVDDPGDGDDNAGDSSAVRTLAKCVDIDRSGVVAPIGTGLAEMDLDDADHADWIHITCAHNGVRMWLWLDPGVAAEAIARHLLARLQLQPITIGRTPTNANAMGYVGVPTWLWVDNPGRVTWGPATISAGQVTATWELPGMVGCTASDARLRAGRLPRAAVAGQAVGRSSPRAPSETTRSTLRTGRMIESNFGGFRFGVFGATTSCRSLVSMWRSQRSL